MKPLTMVVSLTKKSPIILSNLWKARLILRYHKKKKKRGPIVLDFLTCKIILYKLKYFFIKLRFKCFIYP